MSTYSTSLKLTLIGDGEQSGTWGQTTNTNLGTLLEQAITGVVTVYHPDTASYTLTDYNGASDEARNAVLVVTGALTAQRDIIAPTVEKLYVVKNATSGGYAIRIKTSSSVDTVTIPNGVTTIVYCDATNFYEQLTGVSGDFSIGGDSSVGGTLDVTGALSGSTASFSGAISSVSPSFTGTPTAPTAAVDTNTTQIASTAYVFAERTNTATLTNKTLTSPIIDTPTINSPTVSNLYLSDSSIIFEGSTPNSYETTLTAADPTADRTVTIPDSTTTLVGTDTTQTLTNKTINASQLVNASITAPKLNGAQSGSAPIYAARAFVAFDGTSATGVDCTIFSSGNVTKVEHPSTGLYKVFFTTSLPSANYAVVGAGGRTNGNAMVVVSSSYSTNASYVYIATGISSDSTYNLDYVSIAVFV